MDVESRVHEKPLIIWRPWHGRMGVTTKERGLMNVPDVDTIEYIL